jgi:quinol monooxygenase YgiN
MSIVAVADLFGVSSRRRELMAALANAEREAADQPGCVRYSFAATIADPDHFVPISEWSDQAALDAHYESPGFANFQFSLNGLLARPSQMSLYSVAGTARPLASRPMDPRDAD